MRVMDRKNPIKTGAFALAAMCGNNAVVPFDNLFCNGKADTGAFEFILRMQPLEQFENIFRKSFLKTDAIIREAKLVEGAIGIPGAVEKSFPDSNGLYADTGLDAGT